MGRKGVSKRKPKKSGSFSRENINNSSTTGKGTSSIMQGQVKDNGSMTNQGVANPASGPNKKDRKGR